MRAGAPPSSPGRPGAGMARTVVLGLGNVLARDDGVGVEVVRRLAARWGGRPEAARIDFIDGGTLGLELLDLVGGAADLVIIDAVKLGLPPGTVTVLRDTAAVGRCIGALSVHELGLGDLVVAARLLGLDPSIRIVAVEPAEIGVGLGCSPAVARALPAACAAVEAELGLTLGDGDAEAVAAEVVAAEVVADA